MGQRGPRGQWSSLADHISRDFPQRGYIIYCTPGNVWQFWIGTGSGWANVTGPAVELGEWTHVSGVYSADGMKLYVNGALEAEGAGTLSPNTQQRVSIGAGATEGAGGNYYFVGKIDDVRVYDSALSQEHIKTVMDVKPYPFAQSPDPADGAVLEATWVNASWHTGDLAASHDVYMSDNLDDVNSATDAPMIAETTHDPGPLEPDKTYYWRVDEVNSVSPDSPWAGNVWSFTTGEFLTVDDFEDYDVGNNEIWWSWKDGLGYPAREDKGIPAYSGNGTGSTVGDETSPTYMEMTIVQGGSQSMPLVYDNDKQGYAKYSEAELTLPAGKRDWTAEGVSELSLWFRGEEDNAAEPLYVAVAGTAVIYHDDANAAQLTDWAEWVIPLQRLADEGVSLTGVDSIAIGLGTRGNTAAPGGAGTIYIDDIRLRWPKPQQ